ncbi:hypothetical protein [Hoylesella timonensis]|uniref:hypothetical protein n=1 Tax=Hoylesella timonensis TaxID=386414 RepID=UPI00243087D0|nr:hypothetical protein [Hoylesella timonensis]
MRPKGQLLANMRVLLPDVKYFLIAHLIPSPPCREDAILFQTGKSSRLVGMLNCSMVVLSLQRVAPLLEIVISHIINGWFYKLPPHIVIKCL